MTDALRCPLKTWGRHCGRLQRALSPSPRVLSQPRRSLPEPLSSEEPGQRGPGSTFSGSVTQVHRAPSGPPFPRMSRLDGVCRVPSGSGDPRPVTTPRRWALAERPGRTVAPPPRQAPTSTPGRPDHAPRPSSRSALALDSDLCPHRTPRFSGAGLPTPVPARVPRLRRVTLQGSPPG